MQNLILIFVCLIFGLILQKVKSLPGNFHVSINAVILYVMLPALILLNIPKLQWDPSLFSMVLVGWIIFFAAYVFFSFIGSKLNWDKKVIACLILTAGLGNTSFVGFPIIEAVLGQEALKYAVVLDQTGTFLICSTLGIWLVNSFSDTHIPRTVIMKRVLLFPPFVAFAVGVICNFLQWIPVGITEKILQQLASLLAPLALISVGLQLKWRDIQQEKKFLTFGLGFKLVIAPMLIFFIFRLMNVPQKIFEVAVLESAMAPMITSSILAASYGLHPKLAGLMVGFGVPLSFLTLSAWYFLL